MNNYQEILYVVEEALYTQDILKEENFTSVVLEKLDARIGKKSIFLKKYASDLDDMAKPQLGMVVKIAGKDVGILVSILVNHLETKRCFLASDIARNLFENIDLQQTFGCIRYCKITKKLFDSLLLNENNELRSVLKCFYKTVSKHNSSKLLLSLIHI